MSRLSDLHCVSRNDQIQVLRDPSNIAMFLTVGLAVVCFVGAAWAFTDAAPEPYMDEVFHVPQTQAYCRGDYGHWDPKITTLPGLYVFAVAYDRLASSGEKLLAAFGATGKTDVSWQECGETRLRQVNWAFSLGTLYLMGALLRRHMAPNKAWAHAILLWLYPTSFFFSFLFYTDVGATFFFLLCYLLATAPPHSSSWARRLGSAMAGGMSIFFRQTNAVWVAFTLAICLLKDFLPSVIHPGECGATQSSPLPDATSADQDDSDAELEGRTMTRSGMEHSSLSSLLPGNEGKNVSVSSSSSSPPSSSSFPLMTSSVRKRRPSDPQASFSARGHSANQLVRPVRVGVEEKLAGLGRVSPAEAHEDSNLSRGQGVHDSELGRVVNLSSVPVIIVRLAKEAMFDAYHGGHRLRRHIPLAVPVFAFAMFVLGFNGGTIAVGDRENHDPGGPPHLAQLGYLFAVGASLWGFFGQEAMIGRRARIGFISWVRMRGVLFCAGLFFAAAYGSWRYSLAHPFLLSDNRHFPFYVWRRLLRFPALRAGLSPVYVFCGWLFVSRLHERKGTLWAMTYLAAAAVVLVPSPLLEPRYLTVPVLLAHLESGERSWSSILAGVAACTAVNAATIYLFLFRSFHWHDGSTARFMW